MSESMVEIHNVTKVYERGKQKVRGPARAHPGYSQGRLRRAHGPVGLGQDHAAEPDRRVSTSPAPVSIKVGGSRIDQLSQRRARRTGARTTSASCSSSTTCMPVLTRGRQRRAAAAADEAVGRAARRSTPRSRCRWSGLADRAKHKPRGAVRRPGAARGHRARAGVRPAAAGAAMSRPATWIARPPMRSWGCCRCSTASTARPS